MTLIVKIALSVCAICLVSCNSWDWKPDPYLGDHNYQSIMNAEGKEVFCNQKEFTTFTCFAPDNIIELKLNIERVRKKVIKLKLSLKKKKELINQLDKAIAAL